MDYYGMCFSQPTVGLLNIPILDLISVLNYGFPVWLLTKLHAILVTLLGNCLYVN